MTRPPYQAVEMQDYVCADSGRLLDQIPMRRFYAWDDKAGRYQIVRQYPIANEARVNPGFRL